MSSRTSAFLPLFGVTPLIVFLAVYAPSVGLGLISDDFGWIEQSRFATWRGVLELFRNVHGSFYRPLVSITFAVDYTAFGLSPRGYGWTNLLLAITAASLIFVLCRRIGLTSGAAYFAAMVWLLNFHGIDMALLWVSGRTELLMIIGVVAALIGVTAHSITICVVGFTLALLSKEEAVASPFIIASLLFLLPNTRLPRRATWVLAGACTGTVVLYFVVRTAAGAMTPSTAPSFYQFAMAPGLVARNVLEYADRACTYSGLVVLVGWLALRPQRAQINRPLVWFGLAWLVWGYSTTVLLPVRSSLYACLPSVGAALICATLLSAFWEASIDEHRRLALLLLVMIPVACVPIYVSRNHRWTDLAAFSTRALADIKQADDTWPPDAALILLDDRTQRVNLQSTFGTLVGSAVFLATSHPRQVWIEPPVEYATAAGMKPPCESCSRVYLQLRAGRLVALDAH